MTLVVSAENEAKADKLWRIHAEWMKKTHVNQGPKACLFYHVTKGRELDVPTNGYKANQTGKIKYTIVEFYATRAGLDAHFMMFHVAHECKPFVELFQELMKGGATFSGNMYGGTFISVGQDEFQASYDGFQPKPDVLAVNFGTGGFDDWYGVFKSHADSNVVEYKGKKFNPKKARGEFCDEAATRVFRDIDDPDNVSIFLHQCDVPALGAFMQTDPAFAEMTKVGNWKPSVPRLATQMNPPTLGEKEDLFFTIEVSDPKKWIKSFKQFGTSTKIDGWNGTMPAKRSELCDESKTKIFQDVKNPNAIGLYMEVHRSLSLSLR